MATIDDVRQIYANILQRSGTEVSAAELQSYVSAIDSGALTLAQARSALINSSEGQAVQNVVRLYQTVFGRVPDQAGLNNQVDTLRGPPTEADIANSFANSPEFTARFGGNTVNTAFINSVYQQVLGRTPSAGEVDFYLNSGFSAGRIALAFSEAPEFRAGANAAVAAFLDAAGQGTAVYTGPLQGVSTNPGSVFTLTVASDNFTGTAGNDVINGSVSATPADNTLSLTDIINGGAGTDTLNVTASVLAVDIAVPAAGLQSVEVVNIRALDADGTVGTNAATFVAGAGVTAVNADRSSSNVTVTGLANGASVGVIGDGSVNNGILSYAYATATADQVINISGGVRNAGVADITATASTGVTKATINSTGAANSVDTIKLDSAAANTVTSLTVNAATNLTATLTAADYAATADLKVSGAATSVDLGTAFDGKTIDASGLTAGGLTIATNANLTSFKGGQGNDTVTTSALAAAAVAGAVDAGAGTGDILNVATGTDVDTATKAALFTNFEVLRNSGATDLDVSLLSGITSVQLNSANAGATKLTAAQAANIQVLTSNATNTVSLATATGTSDVLGLTLKNLTAAAVATPIDVTALTATGFETLNVVSSSGVKAGGTGTGNDLAFAAAGDLTAINVSGEYDLTIAAANITKAVTITSTQTGTAALYVSGDFANGSTVTGSVGADAFVLGAGFGTYNGGAGNDTFSGTAAQLNTTASFNALNGGDGVDTLNITDGAAAAVTLDDNNLSKVTGIEKIVVASTTTANQSITTGGFVDTNFKASGFDLTTTSTSGSITVNTATFSGVATLAATSTTGAQTITTGVGADKITSSVSTGVVAIASGDGADTISVTHSDSSTGNTVSAGAGNDSITLSVATGKTVVTTITGGTGADTIVLSSVGTSTDTIVLGAGDSGLTLATADKVTNFAAANDVFKVGIAGNATAGSGNYVESSAVSTDFTAALNAANVALKALDGTSGATQLFSFQADATNGYLFHDSNSDGVADQVVVLVGVTATGFSEANLIA